MKYIWQLSNWPNFTYNLETLLEYISESRKEQGAVIKLGSLLELQTEEELLLQEALNTSAIEGETLDTDEVRSSIAYRLGLPRGGLPSNHQRYEGLVEMLIDATSNYKFPLSNEKLFSWHAALFPGGHSGLHNITVGAYRSGKTPMDIVSGLPGKEKTYYSAPPSTKVKPEMDQYIKWWEYSRGKLDGLIRAAYAHLYFVSIHPFEDGNGRIARALTDMALAQDEKSSKRLYSLSSQILTDRSAYYEILEKTQKGSGDITEWIVWFLNTFIRSLKSSVDMIEHTLLRNKFRKNIMDIKMNSREMKVINKMIDLLPEDYQGGMTNRKYVKIAKTSPATAKRDLQELVINKVLTPKGGGRSISYQLNKKKLK
ncbi:MAG: Fic family protein [Spirochaetales bacterium]|nr:Fic family protein [Spirochaetales bacterium]